MDCSKNKECNWLDRSCSHDVTNHANVSFICQKQPEETSTTPSETTTEEGSTRDSETTSSVQPPGNIHSRVLKKFAIYQEKLI